MGIPDMEGHRYFPFYLYLVAIPEDLRLGADPHRPGCRLYQA